MYHSSMYQVTWAAWNPLDSSLLNPVRPEALVESTGFQATFSHPPQKHRNRTCRCSLSAAIFRTFLMLIETLFMLTSNALQCLLVITWALIVNLMVDLLVDLLLDLIINLIANLIVNRLLPTDAVQQPRQASSSPPKSKDQNCKLDKVSAEIIHKKRIIPLINSIIDTQAR